MDKQRSINTAFWSDDYIVGLGKLERYFFQYLLTNEHTNVCGIYKLSFKVMARETDFTEKELNDLIAKFTEDKKMVYKEGWIIMINHLKHQKIKGTLEKAVQKQLTELPPSIYTLAMQYGYPIGTARGIEVEEEVEREGEVEDSNQVAEPKVNLNLLIDRFKAVNPSWEKLFRNKTQRAALERLVKKHSWQGVEGLLDILPQSNGDRYGPTITTPLELEDKLGKLGAWIQKQKVGSGIQSKIAST